MSFEKTLKWLYSFQRFGIKLGLERISHITKELGDPQRDYNILHVGGTNGKGSVCRFLKSILNESGYTTGVYTSPHLQHISERIVVDNHRVTNAEMNSIVNKVKPIVDDMLKDDNIPTFFEIFTAIAFQYFSDKNVDFAVMEVGLGGRYDATNIVSPMVSVITNVSLEHENILGKDIKDIAFEKAGIVKNNIPVVTAAKGDSLKVIKNMAKEKNAPLYVIDEKNIKRLYGGMDRQDFLIKCSSKDYSVETSMLGRHQGENIALALVAVENLQMNNITITDADIIEGIKKTVNPGRMEMVSHKPIILLDGAHNKAGMQVLKETLKKDFDYDRLILVLGILSDKNIRSMLSIISPIADVIIVTKSKNKRACDPSELKKLVGKSGYNNKIVEKRCIRDAINYTRLIAKRNDLICITGSLFTVGEARDYLLL